MVRHPLKNTKLLSASNSNVSVGLKAIGSWLGLADFTSSCYLPLPQFIRTCYSPSGYMRGPAMCVPRSGGNGVGQKLEYSQLVGNISSGKEQEFIKRI